MCDSPELLKALAELTAAVKQQTLRRDFEDITVMVSDTQGFHLDYRGYRYLYVFSANTLTFVIGDVSYAIGANTWTPLQFRQGRKIFTTGTANPLPILIRATDDLFAILSAATVSLSANASVNVNQIAGTGTATDSGTSNAGTQRVIQAGAATGTQTSVASSGSDGTILAANTSRKGAVIYNDSTQILYLLLASGTSSTTNYSVQVSAQGYFELPGPTIYNGVIKGLWAAANGNARVTEFS